MSSPDVGRPGDRPMAASCDVVIIGAGPAGTAAAIELRRGGRDVIVIDRARFPRDKCCGDGLTTLALRELEHLGLRPDAIDAWCDVDGAQIRSPSGREIFVPLRGPGRFAAVAPRLQLDAALVDIARSAGAVVRDGVAFTGIESTDDRVTVIAGGHRVDARYAIAADGMWSPVRKAVGANHPGYLGEWHGFRQYASDVSGSASDRLHVWFEADLLPGYAWSFPLPGGRANVGFGVLRDGGRGGRTGADSRRLWLDLLRRPHVVEALGPGYRLEGRHTAWPIPARVDALALTAGRVLFVGDAAAATDVMTGEGIGQALLTGRLAAEAISGGGGLDDADVARRYRHAVRRHLFADHRMSRALGGILARPWGARGAVRVVQASGDWGRRNFARWMFEDEPRAIAVTPGRWHRGFLRRPGAFSDLDRTG